MKVYTSFEEMMADIQARVEAGREAAKHHHIKVEDLRHGDHFTYLHPELGIPIFGEVVEETEYEEDELDIAMARENGYIFGKCYSVMCVEGELGDTHVTRITHKIDKAVFERAKANGWRHLDPSN